MKKYMCSVGDRLNVLKILCFQGILLIRVSTKVVQSGCFSVDLWLVRIFVNFTGKFEVF